MFSENSLLLVTDTSATKYSLSICRQERLCPVGIYTSAKYVAYVQTIITLHFTTLRAVYYITCHYIILIVIVIEHLRNATQRLGGTRYTLLKVVL